MRKTFGDILLSAQDYVQDDSTSSKTSLSATKTFLKAEINNTVRHMYSRLGFVNSQKQQTASTVADQQFYHLPPDFKSLATQTVTVGTVKYSVKVIDSQREWDRINYDTSVSSDVPEFIFIRRDEYGIFPTPASANTITLNYNYLLKDLTKDDYTTGTVSSTQNSQTITGSGTTFTANMVGRWFRATDDGDWYRISAFGSTTSITLETVFEGSSVSGSAFTIGESPELPVEAHEYIPHRVAGMMYLGIKRNPAQARAHLNYFLNGDPSDGRKTGRASGGFREILQRYASKGRSNSSLVRRNRTYNNPWDESYSTITA